jgi:hypothetical protein
MRPLAVPLVFALLSLGFAPAPLPRKAPPAALAPSMEGCWEGEYGELEVTATHWTHTAGASVTSRLVVDRTTCPPRFDLLEEDGRPKTLGIYCVEGGVLTINYSRAEFGRPTAFEGRGKGRRSQTYKRLR